jgi:phosphoenolpyruvate carboxykinase (ATP)
LANRAPAFTLAHMGIDTGAELHWNLTTAPLIEHAVRRAEGVLAKDGPLVVATGKHTGRSANDKFIVRDAETEQTSRTFSLI